MVRLKYKLKTWTLRIYNSYIILEEVPEKNKYQMFRNPNKFFDFTTYSNGDGLIKVGKFRLMWSL